MAKLVVDKMEEYFFREIRAGARNKIEAYENASQKFEQDTGISAPPSYDAFRKRKERRRK